MVGAEGENFGFSHPYFAGNGHFETMFCRKQTKLDLDSKCGASGAGKSYAGQGVSGL